MVRRTMQRRRDIDPALLIARGGYLGTRLTRPAKAHGLSGDHHFLFALWQEHLSRRSAIIG